MIKPNYKFGVRWIAENDEPGALTVEVIETFISTALLADLFGQDTRDVAADIVAYKNRQLTHRVCHRCKREVRIYDRGRNRPGGYSTVQVFRTHNISKGVQCSGSQQSV